MNLVRTSLAVAALLAMTACSGRILVAKNAPPSAPPHSVHGPVHAPAKSLGIPPGHYPPPGYCRVWVPGRPPGHQARAVPCGSLGDVPLGAWVLHRSSHSKKVLEVAAYDDVKPKVVVSVSYYDAKTGVRIDAHAER